MRTIHSIKNISISIISQVVIVILGFISRKVFLDSLGVDYLGVDGLLTNVLSVLALVEAGIGASIVYNLYKPLADGNRAKVIALVQLYKRAYGVLAIIMLLLSICLYPFLEHLMKNGSSISNISIIYFIFVAKNMIAYLNAHKLSLINADQKGYVLAKTNLIFQVCTTIAKIIVLVSTQNYILYLIIELVIYISQNTINGRIVNKRYPYIKTKEKYPIDKDTKKNLIKNVKAMFLHNIGGYIVFGTDNILISYFISVGTVGIYSNYTMIINQLASLVNPILNGIGASVGNLIATESSDKNYSIFKVAYFVNFWIYSFCVIFLYNLLEPFISWWLGKEYLLDNITFIVILINFYLTGLRTAIATFKNKAGLFIQDKYAPLIEACINLTSSLVLVKFLGLSGIFIGTTISTITTVFWTQPYIVYKNVFKKSVWSYFSRYGIYVVLTLITCLITTNICNALIVGNSFMSLVGKGMICLIVPNIIYSLIFFNSKEFQYIKNVFNSVLLGLKIKLTSVK
ncbi:lipopolysaccharide biosynthesis protein [Bacillus rhizoplanae]|uniref:lipopolysaccharide biosynthesis protein n=1 Tax=Bacillus rhizoplanae TaxID=2880966 RepID=UPI003D1F3B32